MSDLQHVDASREGSQEREDAGEDGAASGFVSPSRSGAAAPDTESGGAAAGGRKRARAAAQGATSAASPARRRLRTNLAGSFAHGGWSRRSTGTSAARPRRASGHAASRGQTASLAAEDTSVQPAADDDGLQDTIDMIGEGEFDRDDEPAAGSAAPIRGITSEAGGRARTSGASTQAAAGPYTSTQITKLSSTGGV